MDRRRKASYKRDVVAIKSFIVDGKHTKTRVAKKEALCVKPSGKLEGLVAMISGGELFTGATLLDKTLASSCEFGLKPTGKIFTLYTSAGGESLWYTATGFKVSPTIVATAAHACTPTLEEDGIDYTLKEIYIYFRDDSGPLLDPDCAKDSLYCSELQIIPPPQNLPQLKYGYVQKNGVVELWETRDDFSFLKLVDTRPSQIDSFNRAPFVYPIIGPSTPGTSSFVIGYPERIDPTEFANEYPGFKYDDINATFGGFERKIVSFGVTSGESLDPKTGEFLGLLLHNAPTLPGDSGGLFLAGSIVGFSGIHIGGAQEINQNLVIPTTNPNLALYYFKAISIDTEDFKSMEAARLKPYYDHFSAQLPENIVKRFAGYF